MRADNNRPLLIQLHPSPLLSSGSPRAPLRNLVEERRRLRQRSGEERVGRPTALARSAAALSHRGGPAGEPREICPSESSEPPPASRGQLSRDSRGYIYKGGGRKTRPFSLGALFRP